MTNSFFKHLPSRQSRRLGGASLEVAKMQRKKKSAVGSQQKKPMTTKDSAA